MCPRLGNSDHDAELRRSGIDPFRVRRYFQSHYGMTFQAYCRAQRMGAAFKQLRRGASLDDIALGNGYESHSGFRDAFMRTFGRAPGNSRGLDPNRCLMDGESAGAARRGSQREGNLPAGILGPPKARDAIQRAEEALFMRCCSR